MIDAYSEGKAATDSVTWANAHYRLGIVREKRGDAAGAKAQFDRVLELRPTHVEAQAARKRVP